MLMIYVASWFLDNPDLDWEPPESLVAWIEKARADSKPIVYVGFGSITVPDPNRVTSRIIEAVLKSQYMILYSSRPIQSHSFVPC